MATSSSKTIQAELDRIGGHVVATDGSGENSLILWELTDGRRVIETNGDPVWEGSDGWAELLEIMDL